MTSQNERNPMSLGNLPEHLKSLREKGDTGSPILVDMGQIVVPKRSYMRKALLSLMLCMFLVLGSMVTYDQMSMQQLTVVVDVQNDANIARIVADSGAQIVSMEQIGNSSIYEVKVNTRKSRSSFLDWLRKNKDVKKADY